MKLNSHTDLDKLIDLDKIIHERVRLGIMAALSVSGKLSFQELKRNLNVTDGNLSVHLRLLEKHNYVLVTKSFVGRKPQSIYQISSTGKEAFKEYIDKLETLIHDIHVD